MQNPEVLRYNYSVGISINILGKAMWQQRITSI